MNFRKCILALSVLALFAGLASAQVSGGSSGSNESCIANAAVPPQLRSEGYTELTGDITLNCTGGVTTAGGAQIPTANVTVYLNGTVTSRLLATSGGASEAILLIDEPGSGLPGYGPTVPVTMCSTSSQANNACTEFAGTYFNGTGNVVVPVQPSAVGSLQSGTPSTTWAGWNAFQGTVSGSSVTFFDVPVLAPGTAGGTRVYRITNIRVNANGITGGGPIPANVVAAIAISGSTSLPISNPQLTTGFIASSLSTSIADFGGGSAGNATLGLTQPLQCTTPTISSGSGPVGNGKLFGQYDLKWTELFGTAFKTRVAATNPNGTGGTGQSATAQQNTPGYIYNSESGYIPYTGGAPSLTGNGNTAGLADFGTRFVATFNNIPAGVNVYVGTTNIEPTVDVVPTVGTTTYAVLIAAENAVENTSGTGSAPTVTATGTTKNGGNGTASFGASFPYYQLPIVNGSAMAIYEIITCFPNLNESVEVPVWLSYTASPSTNSPPPGTMTVNLAYAPNPSSGLFTAAQGGAASSSLTIPRFADTSSAINFAQITICSTALLFPFVTNQNGFDTGIAIADTSVDPFGTAAQNGTCTLNWYSAATTTSNPAASTLGAAGVGSTTPIAGGTVSTALASTTVPGFQGYMIAVCNFQYAHGFAFISDLGARNLAMGYLALVMNQPNLAWRPTGVGETLTQ